MKKVLEIKIKPLKSVSHWSEMQRHKKDSWNLHRQPLSFSKN